MKGAYQPPATGGPVAALRDLLMRRADLEGGGIQITVDDTGSLPFIVPAPYRLVINPQTFRSTDAVTHVRHGLELAWMRHALPDRMALCGVLAARVAMIHQRIERGDENNDSTDSGLLTDVPTHNLLAATWEKLAPHQMTDCVFTTADAEEAARLWDLAAPSEHLMALGGNPRLGLDPVSGLNYYGCKPRPQTDEVTFSSCTASSISERGYSSAESSRRRILGGIMQGTSALDEEQAWLCGELLDYFGIADIADVALAPSGTDATLFATSLIQAEHSGVPLTAIIMGLLEMGNGIPDAAVGRDPITGITHAESDIALKAVALRNQQGLPRAAADIETEIVRAVAAATEKGRVVLHPVDISKTGLLAPSADFISRIRRTYPDRLHIVMDCCQGRIVPRHLRRYLDDGLTVVITGSKFYTGPPFSGAVLSPRGRFKKTSQRLDVSTMLRWAAALSEMRAFAAIPPQQQVQTLQRFGERVQHRIATNPRLVAFPSPLPQRLEMGLWDTQQTIFVFAVRDPESPDRLLDFDTLAQIQRWLYLDISDRISHRVAARICRLGQPVRLGENKDQSLAALRIAGGARLVSGEPSHVLRRGESHLDREIADMDDVMTKLELILDHLPQLMRPNVS